VYKDCISFKILGQEVNLYCSETYDGTLNTVAEFDTKYYYMGNESPNIIAAVIAWQKVNDRLLTQEEVNVIFKENNI